MKGPPRISSKNGFFLSKCWKKSKKSDLNSYTRITTATTMQDPILSDGFSLRISTEPPQSDLFFDDKTLKTRPNTAISIKSRPFSAVNKRTFIKEPVKLLHNVFSLKKNLIPLSQKVRIRLLRLKLNKGKNLIGYNFIKEFLEDNFEDEPEKKGIYIEKIKENLNWLLFIKGLLKNTIANIQNPFFLYESLDKELTNFKEGCFLQIYTFYLKARVYFTYEDFTRALICLKTMEIAIPKNFFEDFRLLNFFYQGKTLQKMRLYKESLSYYLKTLLLSWKLQDKNHESLVYDYIGLIYYYLGDMEISRCFHEKMTLGKNETDKDFINYSLSLYNLSLINEVAQQKLNKTFKRALISHVSNNSMQKFMLLEKKKNEIDHNLNVELKRLETQNKQNKIGRKKIRIGDFIYKNESYFRKKQEKIGKIDVEINKKRVLTHCSFNRNQENFTGIGMSEKFKGISYKSNLNNQKQMLKLIKKLENEINNGLFELEDFAGFLEKSL